MFIEMENVNSQLYLHALIGTDFDVGNLVLPQRRHSSTLEFN